MCRFLGKMKIGDHQFKSEVHLVVFIGYFLFYIWL